jgi:hypothetical protein
MPGTDERPCPDCGGVMHAIKIIDRGGGAFRRERGVIYYTVPEARRSFWTGEFPIEGKLAAYMCQGCARILLYGVPLKEK